MAKAKRELTRMEVARFIKRVKEHKEALEEEGRVMREKVRKGEYDGAIYALFSDGRDNTWASMLADAALGALVRMEDSCEDKV